MWKFWRIFNKKENSRLQKTEKPKDVDSLVDEKENKALSFIFFLAIIGVIGILTYVYQDYVCAKLTNKISYAYSMCATLFFVSGGIFCFSSSIGFLFGIPRSASNNDSAKSTNHYIGNDNLLQISDWLTKIIIGVGLTQLYQIPHLLKHLAHYIIENTKIGNEALLLFVIIYFACIGFLFGYLWTRLYFIKMLSDSDNDVDNENEKSVVEVKPIEVNPIQVKPIEVTVKDEKAAEETEK